MSCFEDRPIEPIDPDFVPRIIAKSKALEQIQKTSAFDAPELSRHFKSGKSSTFSL
jgi:hypothetical protein